MHPYFAENYQYCPRCGAEFIVEEDQEKSRFFCPACGFIVYPQSAPTTTVVLLKNDRLLVAKRAIDPFKGGWDLIGGFVNPGESFEEAAIREVKEETGLTIKIVRFIGSCPDEYDGKPTLTVGFLGEIVEGEVEPKDDVASLHWLELDQLPKKFAFESVDRVLKMFLEELNK